jgi:hypothetical protein
MLADPSTTTGDTTGHSNHGDGSCQLGGAPDDVYEIDIAMDGVLDINLNTTAHLGLHVRDICSFDFGEVACQDSGTAGPQELTMEVFAGDIYYVFVDGYSASDQGAYTLSVQTNPPKCGDGYVQGNESCDPPDGVYCGADCQPQAEICNDMVDNDGNGQVDCEDTACASDPGCPNTTVCAMAPALVSPAMGDTTNGSAAFAGTCTGSGAHEQLFSYTPTQDGVLTISLDSTADLGLYARTTCTDSTTEIGCADSSIGGQTETLAVPVTANTPITIFVDGYSATEMGAFTLSTNLLVFNEVEPNNGYMTATPFKDPFYGNINPSGDMDWIAVTVPGPSTTLTAQVTDIGNGQCANLSIDSEVEIYGTDGTTSLAFNEDYGNDYCSLATATGLAAGTYYVRVASSQQYAPTGTFMYQLKITLM